MPAASTNVSRVPLLAPEAARAAARDAGVPELIAELNIFRAYLHHPDLARRLSDLLMNLLWKGSLDVRLRELVIMRIGWVTGSDYEWTQHWRIAGDLGVPEEDLLAVRDWRSHDAFGPSERAVLAATDETLADGAVSPETWAACLEHVSGEPRVLLELVTAIGLWNLVSGSLRTLQIPLEDGVKSWPPDGNPPQDRSH